jgi:beta-phosphoglucomutase family hydrolase
MNCSSAAVLWDMDGVLVNSGPLHRQAWRAFLAARGLDLGDRVFELGFGRPNTEVLPAFFGDALGADQIAQLSEDKERAYRDLVREQGIDPVPGVMQWLERFAEAGIMQGVATSGCRANAELIIGRLNAARYLQTVITAEDAHRGKPHPDLFLLAAKRLDVPPDRCLVIEDSLHGIRAARAAGMRCLALSTTHPASALSGCAMVLPDMAAFTWTAWDEVMPGSRASSDT